VDIKRGLRSRWCPPENVLNMWLREKGGGGNRTHSLDPTSGGPSDSQSFISTNIEEKEKDQRVGEECAVHVRERTPREKGEVGCSLSHQLLTKGKRIVRQGKGLKEKDQETRV